MNAKGLLYFLGGAVFGGGLTFLLIKEKYKEEADTAISEVKKYYKSLEEKDSGLTVTVKAEDVGADAKEEPSITSYTKLYFHPDDSVTEEDGEDDEEDYSDICPAEPVGHPYCIDEAAFVNEKSYYDKVGLFYYQGNNVITSENYEPVLDWEELIGPDIGARFKLQDRSDEEFNYIYIRNDSIGADYEIALKKESFD